MQQQHLEFPNSLSSKWCLPQLLLNLTVQFVHNYYQWLSKLVFDEFQQKLLQVLPHNLLPASADDEADHFARDGDGLGGHALGHIANAALHHSWKKN